MSLKGLIFGRKQEEVFDSNPGQTQEMPARPYRILHADLPFYDDPDCLNQVKEARLLVLQCEDPLQKQKTIECMPSRKQYSTGLTVQWEINHKKIWNAAWYVNPASGKKEKAWVRAVEFVSRIVSCQQ